MVDDIKFDEIVVRAHRWHRLSAPTWLPHEECLMASARVALQAITCASTMKALFDAVRLCFPFDAAMLETIHSMRPREPSDTIYGVPDEFNAKRARLIHDDIAIDLVQRMDVGVACVDVEVLPERMLHENHYIQELYTRGVALGGVSGLMISARPSWPTGHTVYTTLWLFRGKTSRVPTFNECRMLENLNDDIVAALDRMRIPVSPHAWIESRILDDDDDGVVLLRGDRSIFDANRQAFALSDEYAPTRNTHHRKDVLTSFLRSLEQRSGPSSRVCCFPPSDDATLLDVSMHRIAKDRYGLPEDLTLVRMRKVQLECPGVSEAGRRLLASLPPKQRHVARLLATTRLTAKELAEELSIGSYRSVQKHTERIYAALKISGRDALRRCLTTSTPGGERSQ